MTRVDFYVIENANERQHENLVCRLTEKAWRAGHRVYIRCANEANSASIDNLLWSYKDTSFLPHAIDTSDEAVTVPVTIGYGVQPPSNPDVLINLAADVPDYFSRFERVMETTGSNNPARAAARDRYRYYQERGYALNTHKLDPSNGR